MKREREEILTKYAHLTTFCKMTKMPLSLKSHPTAEIRSNLEINGPD